MLGPARAGQLQKPVLIIAVTDGIPGGEDRYKIVQVITNANRTLSQTRYGPDAVSFQFAQVGNDQKARAFLEELDKHPEIGGLIDTTSNFENEAVSRLVLADSLCGGRGAGADLVWIGDARAGRHAQGAPPGRPHPRALARQAPHGRNRQQLRHSGKLRQAGGSESASESGGWLTRLEFVMPRTSERAHAQLRVRHPGSVEGDGQRLGVSLGWCLRVSVPSLFSLCA